MIFFGAVGEILFLVTTAVKRKVGSLALRSSLPLGETAWPGAPGTPDTGSGTVRLWVHGTDLLRLCDAPENTSEANFCTTFILGTRDGVALERISGVQRQFLTHR